MCAGCEDRGKTRRRLSFHGFESLLRDLQELLKCPSNVLGELGRLLVGRALYCLLNRSIHRDLQIINSSIAKVPLRIVLITTGRGL